MPENHHLIVFGASFARLAPIIKKVLNLQK